MGLIWDMIGVDLGVQAFGMLIGVAKCSCIVALVEGIDRAPPKKTELCVIFRF